MCDVDVLDQRHPRTPGPDEGVSEHFQPAPHVLASRLIIVRGRLVG